MKSSAAKGTRTCAHGFASCKEKRRSAPNRSSACPRRTSLSPIPSTLRSRSPTTASGCAPRRSLQRAPGTWRWSCGRAPRAQGFPWWRTSRLRDASSSRPTSTGPSAKTCSNPWRGCTQGSTRQRIGPRRAWRYRHDQCAAQGIRRAKRPVPGRRAGVDPARPFRAYPGGTAGLSARREPVVCAVAAVAHGLHGETARVLDVPVALADRHLVPPRPERVGDPAHLERRLRGRRDCGDRQSRRRGQLRGRAGCFPHPDRRAIRGRHERRTAGRRGLRALYARQHAGQANEHRRGSQHGSHRQEQARERRRNIEREANFYGAMDGASRFVKGDAIAGIIIIVINIVGGLAIGIAQRGMGWSEALQTFTLLTVGDGIVTQVPALVIATGTGLIVTRAATDARLADEVAKQVLSYPRAVLLVMLALMALAFLPGMPLFAILCLAAVAGGIYWVARRRESLAAAEAKTKAGAGEADSTDLYGLLSVESIELVVGQNLIPLVGAGSSFTERIVSFRKQFALDMGAVFPRVRVKDERKLGPNRYEVRIFGTKVADGDVVADRTLAINPGGARERLDGVATKDPTYGLPAFWILDELKGRAREAGYTVVDPVTVLATHFTEVIKQQAPNLLTRGETDRLIARVREQQPSLVQDLVPKVLTLGEVQKVLQSLLREKVPIRNMEAILEVLSDHGGRVKEADHLTELVRERLGATICQTLANPAGELYVLTFDPVVEQQMTASIRSVEDRSALVIEPRFAEQLLRKLTAEADRMLSSELMPVILCAPNRRTCRRRLGAHRMTGISFPCFRFPRCRTT